MKSFLKRNKGIIRLAVNNGLRKGWKTFLWMARILVPVTLLGAFLDWTGWIYYLDDLLGPVMNCIHLPGEAVLPIVSGMLIGIYGTVAIMAVIPFNYGQMAIIAVFSLIIHNIITEVIIQHKSGISWLKIFVVRLLAAAATAYVIGFFFSDTLVSPGVDRQVSSQMISPGYIQ